MIQQLVERLIAGGLPAPDAALSVLSMDPLDIGLHMEQVWEVARPPAAPAGAPLPAARATLYAAGAYQGFGPAAGAVAWDHLGYSYALENTRAVQIMSRVVRGYRSGEGLGVPSALTQRWLDTSEALVCDAANPVATWLSTSTIRRDPEAVRRNAYWRFFGMDLSFGTDDNRAPTYDKASAANTNFVQLFEELLYELWQAMSNATNYSGVNQADDDRIYRLSEALNYQLQSRRQSQMLLREELAAATVLGWIELTLSGNSAVVVDLRAQATSAADRLKLIGERVGLAPHSRSASLFAMANDLSIFLRMIESGAITGPGLAWYLYANTPAPAIGLTTRRVITEWAAATGRELKQRAKPVETRPKLMTAN
jgi:hypothetical protein